MKKIPGKAPTRQPKADLWAALRKVAAVAKSINEWDPAGEPVHVDLLRDAMAELEQAEQTVPPQCSTCEELTRALEDYAEALGSRFQAKTEAEFELTRAVHRALAACRVCNGAPAQPETSAQPGFRPAAGSYVATPAHSVTALDDFAPASAGLVHYARKSAQTLRVCADYENGRGGGICGFGSRPNQWGIWIQRSCTRASRAFIYSTTCEDPGPMGATCETPSCAPPVRPLCPVCAVRLQVATGAPAWCNPCQMWVR